MTWADGAGSEWPVIERGEAGGPGTEPTGSRRQGRAAVLQPKDMITSNYTPQGTHSCNSSESLF